MLQRTIIHRVSGLILLGIWLAGLPPAEAQRAPRLTPQARPPRQTGQEKVRYPFDATDMVEGYVGPMKKDLGTTASHYFVGEPIYVPLVLANHTKFPITLLTNFNFRSQLTVMIRPEGQPQFRYNGPYFPGYYAPAAVKLVPLEEFHTSLIVWADATAPEGLAIAKPGNYTLEISLQVAVEEAGSATRDLKPHRGVFTIVVDPTPKPLEPLIELFKQKAPQDPAIREAPLSNSVYLQLHKNPPGWGPRTEEIVNQYPNTIFAPFLWYGLASFYAADFNRKPANDLYAKATTCYQYAELQDSPFMEEVYFDLLAFCDAREQAAMATGLARQLIERVGRIAEWRLGRIGNDALLQKYLVDTQELDPEQFWAFLP